MIPEPPALHRYDGEHATVTWDSKRCIHAAACVRGLPGVFSPKSKPWVQPGAVDADALAAAVYRCPSGALKLQRKDGSTEPVPGCNTATITPDGPTYFRGDIEIIAADGAVMMSDTRVAICRCGGSRNKPLCDGTHRSIEFRDEAALRGGQEGPPTNTGGRLTVRPRPNGPLMCTGALTVVDANGRTASARSMVLCRCGASKNKPYCDGTHRQIGFVG